MSGPFEVKHEPGMDLPRCVGVRKLALAGEVEWVQCENVKGHPGPHRGVHEATDCRVRWSEMGRHVYVTAPRVYTTVH